MANASVGGLYVAVTLDTRMAARQLAAMGATYTKALAAGTAAAAVGTTAAAAATRSQTQANKNAIVQMTKYRAIMATARAATTKFGASAALAGKKVTSSLGSALGGIAGRFTGLIGGLAGTTAGIAGLVVVALAAVAAIGGLAVATFKLGKAGFNTAVDLELLEVSLTAILGSASAAQSEMNALINTAIESPFLTPVVIEMDKFLLSQGLVSAEIRGNLIPAILDMSAAYGLSSDNLRSISYAMAQVQSRGYLSGDELRQLANQLVPVWKILREIPEYAKLSQSEIRKLSEAGEISAETFQRAVISYSEQFAGAAEKAANTVAKLAENIKDITTIRLGKAFLDADKIDAMESPLTVVRDLLLAVKDLAKEVDFAPLAAGMGNFTDQLIGPITDFITNNAPQIQEFFEYRLPAWINTAAKIVHVLWAAFKVTGTVIIQVLSALWTAFTSFTGGLGKVFGGWTNIWKGLAIAAAVGAGVIVTVIQAVASAIQFLVALITGQWSDAGAAFVGIFGSINAGINTAINSFRTMSVAIDAAGDLRLPDLSHLGEAAADYQDAADDFAAAGDTADSGGASGGAAKVSADIEKAMDVLWDLTRRWQGFRSDLEKGLLGDEGFTATMNEIISMGQKVNEALLVIGDTAAADRVADATLRLYKLAQERNAVADSLADAESALADIIAERQSFNDELRKSAIEFAASLDLEEKVVQKWNQQSERGFFSVTETTETKSFTESLRERAAALTAFYEDIRALQAGGLNADLLRQLLEAGPEDGGGVAAQLAAGGASLIGETNALYDGIAETAEALGEFGAEEFYDAGVEDAQGLVDGLESQLAAIEATADALGEIIYQEALTWAAEMEEAGAAAGGGSGVGGGGFAGGLEASAPAVGHAAAVLANDALHEFDGLGSLMYDVGEEAGEQFLGGLEEAFAPLTGWLLEQIDRFKLFAVGVKLGIENVLDKLRIAWDWTWIKSKFQQGMQNLANSLPQWLKDALGWGAGAIRWVGNALVPGSFPQAASLSALSYNSSFAAPATQMTGASASTSTSLGYGGSDAPYQAPIIKVYIGDVELKEIVRTEVVYSDSEDAMRVQMGRRV